MADSETQSEVFFDYIKSAHFRVVHVDGAVGSIAPNMSIHATIFSERVAIPQRIYHRLNDDATLGPEITEKRATRGGIVRELEADLIFSADAARQFAQWLLDRATELDAFQARTQEVKGGNGHDAGS